MSKNKTMPVLLAYDYWNEDGCRLLAGTIADLQISEVKKLIQEGKADRADPMPSDD